jgi:hypothetical protein
MQKPEKEIATRLQISRQVPRSYQMFSIDAKRKKVQLVLSNKRFEVIRRGEAYSMPASLLQSCCQCQQGLHITA